MSKYESGPGDVLDMLGEEAVEIAQEIFKIRRFGEWGLTVGYTGAPPIERLHQEVADFLAILERAIDEGRLDVDRLLAGMAAKHKRLHDLFGVERISRTRVALGK